MRSGLSRLLALSAVLVLSACGGALYAPCDNQTGCSEGLRCINIGGDYGAVCTRPCSVTKDRAGYPDALDENSYFEDGTTTEATVTDAACAEGDVTVTSEDTDGAQRIGVSGDVVGVCRVSPEQLASDEIAADSILSGWCTPL